MDTSIFANSRHIAPSLQLPMQCTSKLWNLVLSSFSHDPLIMPNTTPSPVIAMSPSHPLGIQDDRRSLYGMAVFITFRGVACNTVSSKF
eukprot:3935921-Rhodomonas_salina.1